MRNRFDTQLDLLNRKLIYMGVMCEKIITLGAESFFQGKVDKNTISEIGKEIDDSEKEIESICMKLLLQQQPVAKDLRQISSALKMITDMKRIGNQVENIVDLATNLDSTYAENYLSIGRMAESTIRMVKLSIQAFVNKDLEMAKEAKLYDDIIDDFFCLIKNDLISIIHQNPDSGEYAIDVLMIAKYFERIGDHATNIAEWVEFSITGMHGE